MPHCCWATLALRNEWWRGGDGGDSAAACRPEGDDDPAQRGYTMIADGERIETGRDGASVFAVCVAARGEKVTALRQVGPGLTPLQLDGQRAVL